MRATAKAEASESRAGTGKLTSKKGVLNFVTALLQANMLYAMSVIIVNVERTRLWICAGEVRGSPALHPSLCS